MLFEQLTHKGEEMAAPQSTVFQLQYRESGSVRSMQQTPPSQLQTGSEKPLSTLWFHVTILSLMSEGKNILHSQKYPDSKSTLFKATGHVQCMSFRTIHSYEHLRHVHYQIHCPTIHQTTVFLFQPFTLITHLLLQRNAFTWEKPVWTLISVRMGIVPALSGNQRTVSTRDHDEPDSHSAEGEAAIAEAPDITDWPGSFFSTENVGVETASGL